MRPWIAGSAVAWKEGKRGQPSQEGTSAVCEFSRPVAAWSWLWGQECWALWWMGNLSGLLLSLSSTNWPVREHEDERQLRRARTLEWHRLARTRLPWSITCGHRWPSSHAKVPKNLRMDAREVRRLRAAVWSLGQIQPAHVEGRDRANLIRVQLLLFKWPESRYARREAGASSASNSRSTILRWISRQIKEQILNELAKDLYCQWNYWEMRRQLLQRVWCQQANWISKCIHWTPSIKTRRLQAPQRYEHQYSRESANSIWNDRERRRSSQFNQHL